nr:Chain C, SLP-76 ADAPTOR PROTEIN [Gallus gallus]4D0D_F Chain F, SLP-76 ADAPTOR PROTEIN [Gallus gallus]4D0D_I Chain I, SLP-76 ADAPTOR PROTEIN [Gallus gallus]4D0D_L Chain L, SLP-76 ADAPTOR PROTEIN [Gallus gallus]
VIFPAKSL